MSPILKLETHDEQLEREFEIDYLLSLSFAERFEMMISRSNEIKESLIRNGHRKPAEIIKRTGR